MRKFAISLILFVIAVWVGVDLASHPGYALFVYKRWTVEMPLWLLFVGALVVFVFLYFFIRLFSGLSRYRRMFRYWRKKRRRNFAHKRMCHGLIELIEGHWRRAERYLTSHVKDSETPLVNYLMAARAAHAQEAFDRRDQYLRLAHQASPEAKIAIGLTQAELQLDQQQLEQALATLSHLKGVASKHPYILQELYAVYYDLSDWQGLKALLPSLKKYQVLTDDELQLLEVQVHEGLIFQAQDAQSLKAVWKHFPKHIRHNLFVTEAFASQLIAFQEEAVAEEVIRERLKHHWSDTLALLYTELTIDIASQLKTAIRWSKQHPLNAIAQYICGYFYLCSNELEKAKAALEESLRIDEQPKTLYCLGEVCEAIGDLNRARELYKSASN
ncbi:MAG: heme biosynthesis HemY N-terminal domain-containing protein [Gammaproteobacteria bacterium]